MTRTKNVDSLSRKEKEILLLISRGYSSREIAKLIFLSPNTVNTHRKNIIRKTGTRNILEAVALAIHTRTICLDQAA
jgi:DNA-binding CsgD family transcriptional regulator